MLARTRFPIVALWAITATLVLANSAMAYVGPGAGMEFIAYAIGLLAMVGMAFFSILTWPFYAFVRWLRGNKAASTGSSAAAPTPASDTSQQPAPPDVDPNKPPSPSVP